MTSKTSQRNNLLDMLKFISIASVVAVHTLVPYEDVRGVITPLLSAIAVPVFLIISAYLRAKKIKKLGVNGVYQPKYLFNSIMSLMLGYFIAVLIEIIGCFLLKINGIKLPFGVHFFDSVPDFLLWFLSGTVGFGSYYIPIIVEMILFLPLLYLLFQKNKNRGLFICFCLNLAYDLLFYFLGLPSELYRLLIFRYIFVLGCGIYLGLLEERDKKTDTGATIFLILGLVYVVINAYIYEFPFFGTWSTSSLFVGLFAGAYVYFMMKHFSDIPYHRIFVFGKASYHIFLCQLMFFFFRGNKMLVEITSALPKAVAIPVQIVLAWLITFALGLLFYNLETRLRKALGISH